MRKASASADTPVNQSTSVQTKPTSEPATSIPTAATPDAAQAVPRIKVHQQGRKAGSSPTAKI